MRETNYITSDQTLYGESVSLYLPVEVLGEACEDGEKGKGVRVGGW